MAGKRGRQRGGEDGEGKRRMFSALPSTESLAEYRHIVVSPEGFLPFPLAGLTPSFLDGRLHRQPPFSDVFRGWAVTVVDFSRTMLGFATEKARSQGHSPNQIFHGPIDRSSRRPCLIPCRIQVRFFIHIYSLSTIVDACI